MLPKPVHVVNEGLAFLLELVALVLLAVWGFRVGANAFVHFLLGLGAPALMIVVWGAFAAPRAKVIMSLAGVLVVKFVVFGAATAAGYTAGWRAGSVAVGIVAVLNSVVAAFDRRSLLRLSRDGASSSAP
jgi:hypothetical protein